jgi:hypothetical protein
MRIKTTEPTIQTLDCKPAKNGQFTSLDAWREMPPYRRSTVIAVSLVVASGTLAYANSFSVPFVFDGDNLIEQNSAIHNLWPPWRRC